MRHALMLLLVLCLVTASHAADTVIDLTGDWLISPLQTATSRYDLQTQKQSEHYKLQHDTRDWRKITLPLTNGWSGWDTSVSPEKQGKSYWAGQHKTMTHNVVWYRKTFNTPKMAADRCVILHFDAIAWESAIWVNGQHVMDHRGSFTPINVDITDDLQNAGPNLIAVCAISDYGDRPIRHVYGKMFFADQNMAGIIGQVSLQIKAPTRVDHARITPDLQTRSVDVDYEITHAASYDSDVQVQVQVFEHNQPDATPIASKNLGKTSLKSHELQSGKFQLALPDAKPWALDSPTLYDLKFSLSRDGKTLSTSTHRFGMRQFIANENRFYLNGQRVRLYIGNTLTYGMFKFAQDGEEARFKKWLLRQKEYGVNTIRYHMAGIDSYRMLKVCDEVGMFVINEWAWFHRVEYGLTKPDQLAEFHQNNDYEMSQWIKRDYNHPSCVIWSLANEVWTKNEIAMLDHTYEQMRRLDPSGRPMTNSSGFHSVIRKQTARTDIYDFHNYSMHSSYAWPQVGEGVDADLKVLHELYGKIDKPIIITESLSIWKPTAVKLKDDSPQQYVKNKDTRYVRELGMRALADRNDAYNNVTGDWSIRVLETFRQQTLIQGFGPWFDNRFRLPASIKHVYGPQYVGFDVNRLPHAHVYAGKDWQADVVLINDAMSSLAGKLQLEITTKGDDRKTIALSSESVIYSANIEKQHQTLHWQIPADLHAGEYLAKLLWLDAAGRTLASNQMTLHIAPPLQVSTLSTDARVGILSGEQMPVDVVSQLVSWLGVHPVKIDNFDSLDKVDVLILPEKWAKNVESLPVSVKTWIEQGGRLLMLAPGKTMTLDGITNVQVLTGNNMRQPFVDIVKPGHPVLAGISAAQLADGFNSPQRFSVMSMIKPLTVNAILAAGSYSSDGQLAVLREARIGQGATMLTTLELCSVLSDDPVAMQLLLNMLRYVISGDINKHAPVLDQLQQHPVREILIQTQPEDWQTIPLFDFANAPLKNTLGSGSTLDFEHLPLGRQLLLGVPFTLAQSSDEQRHAIIAMQGHRMPQLPARVDGVVIGSKIKRLAFFQSAYYAAPGLIAQYQVHYMDGSSVSIPVIGGQDVGDWFSPKDLPNAMVGWQLRHPVVTHATVGAYIMLWENPRPDVKITSLDIISQGTEQQVGSTLMLLGLSAQIGGK